jgi:hypothetical protein
MCYQHLQKSANSRRRNTVPPITLLDGAVVFVACHLHGFARQGNHSLIAVLSQFGRHCLASVTRNAYYFCIQEIEMSASAIGDPHPPIPHE